MKEEYFNWLYIGIGIAGVLFIIIVIMLYIENRENPETKAFKQIQKRSRLEWKNARLVTMYLRLKKIPILKDYVRQIERRYLSACPYDELSLMRLTAESIGYTLACSIGSVLLLFLLHFLFGTIGFYTVSCCVLISYVCYIEVLNSRVKAVEDKVANGFIDYIAGVKHLFLHYRDVPQAVLEAADGLNIEIRLHAQKLYQILNGANRQPLVKEYALSDRTSWYLKLFLSQAYDASERGEIKKADGSSIFTSNLEFLRLEIMRESHSRNLRGYRLQGYTFVILTPYFCIPFLKQWGMDFFPDLTSFYNGSGQFVIALSFFVTLFCYGLITKAKRLHYRQVDTGASGSILGKLFYKGSIKRLLSKLEERIAGKTKLKKMLSEVREDIPMGVFFLKMISIGIVMFFVSLTFIFTVHTQNKNDLLARVDNISNIASTSNEKQKQLLAENILLLTNKYKTITDPDKELIRADLLTNVRISNKTVVTAVVEEVVQRVHRYQNEYMKWYEFLVALLLAVAMSFLPVFDLYYRMMLMKTERNREIKQFQVLILMEKHFPGVTIAGLLEEMETFALLYQPAIRRCLNNFSAGPKEALYTLKMEEKDSPRFTEIIDGFLSVDTAGIQMAFDEIGSNREMLEKTEALEEEINLNRHVDMADIVAYIPALLVVGVYFIVPICMSAIVGTGDIFALMDEFNKENAGMF